MIKFRVFEIGSSIVKGVRLIGVSRSIKGKLYSIATAKRVAYYCPDENIGLGDFDHLCETLYRKKNGEYFLHGDGGARTIYAIKDELGGYVGGDYIIPLTIAEAKIWAENRLKTVLDIVDSRLS